METNDNNKKSATEIVKEIKRRTKRKFTAEEKITIVLEGLRGEDSIAGVCRKHGIHTNNYFKWSKDFIEAGKRRLSGDVLREANREEVTELRKSVDELERTIGKLYVERENLKKTLHGLEEEDL
jgi:transposase